MKVFFLQKKRRQCLSTRLDCLFSRTIKTFELPLMQWISREVWKEEGGMKVQSECNDKDEARKCNGYHAEVASGSTGRKCNGYQAEIASGIQVHF